MAILQQKLKHTCISFLLLVFLSACASSPHIPIGLPSCDTPIPVTIEIWNDLDRLRETMSHNQLVDEECVEKLRARIRLHDDAL